VRRVNRGPLPDSDLLQVYERIIDVMRKIQKEEITPPRRPSGGSAALETEVND
jgi:chorismate mutase